MLHCLLLCALRPLIYVYICAPRVWAELSESSSLRTSVQVAALRLIRRVLLRAARRPSLLSAGHNSTPKMVNDSRSRYASRIASRSRLQLTIKLIHVCFAFIMLGTLYSGQAIFFTRWPVFTNVPPSSPPAPSDVYETPVQQYRGTGFA